MAILIINNKEYKVPDGSPIADACHQEGLVFDCNTGVCGQCQISVLEGAENLSGLTDEEKDLGLDAETRLGCLCAIQKGTVKITF